MEYNYLYIPSRWSANLSLKVLPWLRNEDDIFIWASLAILQYPSHTSMRSKVWPCSADCSSSWQSHSNVISTLLGDIFAMCLVLRLNWTMQLRWYVPSAAVRSFTQNSLTLKVWSYFAASSILLLTFISCIRWGASFQSCWQNIHCFQFI